MFAFHHDYLSSYLSCKSMDCDIFSHCVVKRQEIKCFRYCIKTTQTECVKWTNKCGQRLNVHIWWFWSVSRGNRQIWTVSPPLLPTCAHSPSFTTFLSFSFLNTSFHPIESPIFFHASPFFTSLSPTLPSFYPSSFFLHSFFSPAARTLCHPFFLIRLFVPSVPLPGVSSSVSMCVRSGSRLL